MATSARWRFDHNGVRDVEVTFRDSCSIRELAAALESFSVDADHPGCTGDTQPLCAPLTLESGGRCCDPGALAVAAAPRSGSTVRLRAIDRHDPAERGERAPVVVRPACAADATEPGVRLTYGDHELIPGVSMHVGDRIVVRDTGAGVTLNGIQVRGNAAVGHGDLLRSGGWGATVAVGGILRPPLPDGPIIRAAVQRGTVEAHEAEPVDLPCPPGRQRDPGFPWLTAMVPLLMAAGVWVTTRSVLLMAFMGFSFVYVLASGIEARLESRAAHCFAIASFRDDLDQIAIVLTQRRRCQEARDENHHPCVEEALGWIDPTSHRLWERSGVHPKPLVVRLGTADRAADDPVVPNGRVEGELHDEVLRVVEDHDPTRRPLTLDLAATGGLAIVGDDDHTLALATAITAQLVMLDPPDQLSLELESSDVRWRWVHWLPHIGSRGRHSLQILDRSGASSPASPEARPGSCAIWRAADSVDLPESLRAVVYIDNSGIASLQVEHDPPIEFDLEGITPSEVEPAARALSGLGSGGAGCDGPPEHLDPAALGLIADPESVAHAWRRSSEGLPAPLGQVRGGGVLSVDLTRDGPHGLVAGTTGSGKSELLRTMLLGIAARHPPERASFLLVDYKGGAAFGALARLPHCVGLVTDLGATEVSRTLVSLRAELRRREHLLSDHDASDVSDLRPGCRPASLLLVVDEFAALVAEVPEFLDGVLDIAQRGRSLGVHLILATQRPAGVISDAVRANTSLRIALRLPDADDSSDVIDSTAAARIEREVPGRALARLAHDTLVEVQVAHTGAPVGGGPPVEVRVLGAPEAQARSVAPPGTPAPPGSDLGTQLDALVDAIGVAAELTGVGAPPQPVPPPLPRDLTLEQLTRMRSESVADHAHHGAAPLGLVDRPDRQCREALAVDPMHSGGVLVIGGPNSGASTALVSLAQALGDGGDWTVHAIDASRGLGDLDGNSAVATIVDGADHETVRRLLEGLTARLDDPDAAMSERTLVLVDGFGAFEELQSPINRGWAIDALVSLALRGRTRGITVALSVRRRSEVPPALANALGERIVLRCVDEDEAAMLDAPAELADPGLPPGRAWVKGHWAQVARPDQVAPRDGAPGQRRAPRRHQPPRLPKMIHLDSIAEPGSVAALGDRSPWLLPIGVRAADLDAAVLDLTRGHALLAGPPRCGCTSALEVLELSARRRGITTVRLGSQQAEAALEEALGRVGDPEPPRVLGLLDEIDRRLEDPEIEAQLERWLAPTAGSGLRFVAAGEVSSIMRCYSPELARLRTLRTGVVFGPDATSHGDVLHHDLPRRDDIADSPGRGWLTSRSGAELVQLATA